jgi:hypothetical protein
MTRKTFFFLLLLIAPLVILFAGYLVFSFSGRDVSGMAKRICLQDGDLVFRRGRSVESYGVFLAGHDREYSHVGVVIMENGIPFVIHAVPGEKDDPMEFIRKESLVEFLGREKASHFAVYRSRLPVDRLKKVSGQAELFYFQKRKFDNDYDLRSDRELYCTELVLKAYRGVLEPIRGIHPSELNFLIGRKKIILPDALIHSPDFFRVCSE